jgi:hypothetical protein
MEDQSCLICECYPDGAVAADDPMSIDRERWHGWACVRHVGPVRRWVTFCRGPLSSNSAPFSFQKAE